jgi:hypothetical protein
MEKIDKILGRRLANKGLAKASQGALVCFYAKEWGIGLFQPISFSYGVLKVSVASSPAASELNMKEGELVDFLNKKIGRNAVRSIRIITNNQ